MASSATSMGITETSATGESLILNLIQRKLVEQSALLPTIMNYTNFVTPGAKQVGVPKLTNWVPVDKVENTSAAYQLVTASTDDILLNVYKTIVAQLEDRARSQSIIDWDSIMLDSMAKDMAAAIESSIAGALVKATNAIQLSGTSNLLATQADILEAKRILTAAKVPLSDRFLAVPPGQEKALLSIAGFVSATDYGSAQAIQQGVLGNLYGFKVVVSNSFASDTEFVAYHREHVGFAMGLEPKFEKQRAPLTDLADDYALSAIWGVKQMNSGALGVYADESVVS